MSSLCHLCGYEYNCTSHLNRHLINVHHICSFCNAIFDSTSDCRHHINHECDLNENNLSHITVFECEFCKKCFISHKNVKRHYITCRSRSEQTGGAGPSRPPYDSDSNDSDDSNATNTSNEPFIPSHTAMGGRASITTFDVTRPTDLHSSLADVAPRLQRHLRDRIRLWTGVRWYLTFELVMTRALPVVDEEESIIYLQSGRYISLFGDMNSLSNQIKSCSLDILEEADKVQLCGSGFILKRVNSIKINCAVYKPLGTYNSSAAGSAFIPTPKFLSSNRIRLLNIHHFGTQCFLYCIAAALFPIATKNATNPRAYDRYLDRFNVKGLKFPMAIKNIGKFEKLNLQISVNVYGIEGPRTIFPVRITKVIRPKHVDLLLLMDNISSHYLLVRDLSLLCRPIKSRNRSRIYICHLCLVHFSSSALLLVHRSTCLDRRGSRKRVRFPEEGKNILEFNQFEACQPVDFYIVADFETVNIPLLTCSPNPLSHRMTHKTHLMVAGMCSYSIMSGAGERVRGPITGIKNCDNVSDVGTDLILNLFQEYDWIQEQRKLIPQFPLSMSQQDEIRFQNSTNCGFCHKEFTPDEVRHRDHRHDIPPGHPNHFRWASHPFCNMAAGKRPSWVPVIFHNLKRFDGRILMESLAKMKYPAHQIKVIARTKDNFMTIELEGKLKFFDSYLWLPASLATLVDALKVEELPLFRSMYPSAEKRRLLTHKLTFCHDYMIDMDSYAIAELPSKDCFYSQLSRQQITDESYDILQQIWRVFNIKNLGELTKLYCELDINLSICCIEEFRRLIMNTYGLEVVRHVTLAQLSWNCCLKFTGARIELVTDPSVQDIIDRCRRGGYCQVTERLVEKNRSCDEDFDPSKVETRLLAFDCRNQYGAALKSFLPCGGFEFLDRTAIGELERNNFAALHELSTESDVGYILEVDLKLDKKYHDSWSSYPPCPVNMDINFDMLDPDTAQRMGECGREKVVGSRLVTTLYDRYKYAVYGYLLALYLEMGVKVTKVHRVLRFKQAPIFRPYVQLNTRLRAETDNEFFRMLYKNLINIIYGRSCMQVWNHTNIVFVSDPTYFEKLAALHTFKAFTIINENFVIVEKNKPSVLLKTASFIGSVICELAKYYQYSFKYRYLRQVFTVSECTCILSDTDSFILRLSGVSNPYQRLLPIRDAILDGSSYPEGHVLHDLKNRMVPGMYADETGGRELAYLFAVAVKLYCLKIIGGKVKKKVKSVPRVAAELDLEPKDFKDSLLPEHRQTFVEFFEIAHDGPCTLYIQKRRKLAISGIDVKRFYLPETGGLTSLPYGHYLIKEKYPEQYYRFLEREGAKREERERESSLLVSHLEGERGGEREPPTRRRPTVRRDACDYIQFEAEVDAETDDDDEFVDEV